MFDENEWRQLVGKLMQISSTGKLEWSLIDGVVSTTLGDFEYSIGSVDGDGRPPYFLRIWNQTSWQEIGKLISEPIQDPPWDDGERTAGQSLLELRHVATRLAYGAPQLLTRLLSELDSLKSPDVPF